MAEARQAETIDVEKARELIASGDGQALDLRTDEDWHDGHVPNALHLAGDDLDELDLDDERLKDRKIIVLGGEDERASRVLGELGERGFEALRLEGGMDAWDSEKFPIQPSEDPSTEI